MRKLLATAARVGLAAAVVILLHAAPPILLLPLAHVIPPWLDLDYALFGAQVSLLLGMALAMRVPLRSMPWQSLPGSGVTAVAWLWLGALLVSLLVSITVVSTSAADGFSVSTGAAWLAERFRNTGPAGGLLRHAVLGPVAEELLFRWLLIGCLLRTTSPRVSLAVSTVLFAASHTSTVVPALLGIAFGLLYLRYSSVLLCIVAHAGHNLLAPIAGPFLVAYLRDEGFLGPIRQNLLVLQLAWSAVALACFLVFVVRVAHGLHFDRAVVNGPQGPRTVESIQ